MGELNNRDRNHSTNTNSSGAQGGARSADALQPDRRRPVRPFATRPSPFTVVIADHLLYIFIALRGIAYGECRSSVVVELLHRHVDRVVVSSRGKRSRGWIEWRPHSRLDGSCGTALFL